MRIRRYAKRRYYSLLLLLTMSVVQSLGSLIHPLPSEQRKEVRDLEKVTLRRCKTECSLLFNSTCVNEKLVPNYTNFLSTSIIRLITCLYTTPSQPSPKPKNTVSVCGFAFAEK